jgi:adenylate cyclase
MNMVNMLLDGKFFKPLPDSTLYSWIMLSAGTLAILIVMLFGNAILDLFSVVSIVAGLYYLDTFYLLPQGYDIKLFFCLLSPMACYSWTTFLHFYSTSKEKAKIKGTFSRYVSPAVVEEMTTNPDKVRVGGEKKNITVFFSDVRDFTSISEKLTPEGLSTCLNMYMGVMTDIIFEKQGTLDKYIGDAIVAFWGAPMPLENHAYQAIKASIAMIEALPKVNEDFERLGYPLFKHGIGLNTGECSVGNMGSDKIFQYTALGDNMNLGARLEALCKFYGVELNVSEYTIAALTDEQREEITYRILDKVRVKGKENAVTIYEVFHSTHDFMIDKQALADYNLAFDSYQNKEFEKAIGLLSPLCEKYPNDKSCKRVKEICESFLENPPPEDWDGVYTHTTKG